ncbi:hypothetical protein FHR72_000141 [Mycolicibacterium iranicum]|uniref:MFS transporter n=1 Tax=Mycolicibacterium iranicum TaxID=912594 RepID=A0A839Q159_MYCIR|nr:MFS transporter [Mycolicibacterium iranicum]MBB2988684.1 hypothetical protein [Mycolicibacterium iranicum]
MLGILRNPTFRSLFGAQVVALIGTGLLTVALGLLAYALAGDDAGTVLGSALAIKMAAYVLVAPVITAAAYRVPPRTLLIGANVLRAGIAALLPWVEQTWQIYVLVFVLQAASATFTPAFQSVLPAVLDDDEDYTRGLTLSRLAYDLESLLSPALAAALLVVVTYDNLFLGTALGFVLSGLLVHRSAIPRSGGERAASSFWTRTTDGVRHAFGRPVLRALLALNMVVAAATALVVVNTVVYAHTLLHADGGSAMAVLLACYGAGSMAAALSVPALIAIASDRRVMLTGAAIVLAGLGATAATLLLAPPATTAWMLLSSLWVVLGAGTSLINTPAARLVRDESVPETRCALFTAQFSLSHACFFVTYPLAGWLGASAGQGFAAVVLAGLAAVAAVVAATQWASGAARDGVGDPAAADQGALDRRRVAVVAAHPQAVGAAYRSAGTERRRLHG